MVKVDKPYVQHLPKVDFQEGWNQISTHSSGRYGKHLCCRCQKFQKGGLNPFLWTIWQACCQRWYIGPRKKTHFQSKIYLIRNPEYLWMLAKCWARWMDRCCWIATIHSHSHPFIPIIIISSSSSLSPSSSSYCCHHLITVMVIICLTAVIFHEDIFQW